MQEQNNDSPEENMKSRERAGQAGEVFSFQEVVYSRRPINRGLQYLIGLAIGAIPLGALLLSAYNVRNAIMTGILGQIALYGFIAVFIGMIVCLCIPRVRFVGYGLLTMVLIAPVVFFISCVVSMQHACGGRYQSPC
jgi:hypothetical protein